MKYTGTLEAIHSRRDSSGNVYWAFRYTDHDTGKIITGLISGGESNIYSILRHWNVPDDWDRSILYSIREVGKREFKQLTKGWDYAGCRPEDLANYIRDRLFGK